MFLMKSIEFLLLRKNLSQKIYHILEYETKVYFGIDDVQSHTKLRFLFWEMKYYYEESDHQLKGVNFLTQIEAKSSNAVVISVMVTRVINL